MSNVECHCDMKSGIFVPQQGGDIVSIERLVWLRGIAYFSIDCLIVAFDCCFIYDLLPNGFHKHVLSFTRTVQQSENLTLGKLKDEGVTLIL